jgi:hypothetical protein
MMQEIGVLLTILGSVIGAAVFLVRSVIGMLKDAHAQFVGAVNKNSEAVDENTVAIRNVEKVVDRFGHEVKEIRTDVNELRRAHEKTESKIKCPPHNAN